MTTAVSVIWICCILLLMTLFCNPPVEVLSAVKMWMLVFWVAVLSRLVCRFHCFREVYYLHL
jgi:hypothetical protein